MSTKHVAIYARVSSSGQNLEAQGPDLQAWADRHRGDCSIKWYEDTFTGATLARPGMERLEKNLGAGLIETVVVWRLDRLGRTALETLAFLDQLRARDVDFVSIRDGFDSESATGRLLRTILAAFAEYEREVMSERIRAGIAKAKANGKRWGGRKPGVRPTLTPETLHTIGVLLEADTARARIARQLGISRSTVYEAIRLIQNNASRDSAGGRGQAAGGEYNAVDQQQCLSGGKGRQRRGM